MNPDAVNAINTLRVRGEQLHIVPQNLIEFWNVYTRPIERNGLGRTVTEAQTEINRLKTLFSLLLDTPAIYQEWERLVVVHAVIGVNVHDARLVAAMLVHGLTHILTFNISDFARYSEITAVHPTAIP
jgi:predicted nucleic acid-binding protein